MARREAAPLASSPDKSVVAWTLPWPPTANAIDRAIQGRGLYVVVMPFVRQLFPLPATWRATRATWVAQGMDWRARCGTRCRWSGPV